MKNIWLKKIISFIPEILFLLFFCFWIVDGFIGGWNIISYVSILFLGLIITLIITKNKIIASALSIVFIIGSIFMQLAVVSEFFDFPVITGEAVTLLLVGSLLFLSIIVMSLFIFHKYVIRSIGYIR